jgi:predicted MFS family arabinose efflux permease
LNAFKTSAFVPKGVVMSFTVYTYLLYLGISIALTVWVARTLHKNGRIFLVDVFRGNSELADSVNHLLVVGFYLINLGYVTRVLKIGYEVATLQQSIEALSEKVGLVLLMLGLMHFFNLYVFSRMRRRSRLESTLPPVEPDACLPAGAR